MKINMCLIVGLNIKQIYSPSLHIKCEYAYKESSRRQLKKSLGYINTNNHVEFEDHHIFPKCLKNHPILYDVEINSGKNLKIMPSKNSNYINYYKNYKNSNKEILCHGPHDSYNKYVKNQLDQITYDSEDERRYKLWLLLNDLDSRLNYVGDIPFK